VKNIAGVACKIAPHGAKYCPQEGEVMAHIENASEEERAEAQFVCKVINGVNTACSKYGK